MAFLIQLHNLAIQDGTLALQTAQHLLQQPIKMTELLPLARQQPGVLEVDIQHAAKAVVLQLVDPIRWPIGSFRDVKLKGGKSEATLRGAFIVTGVHELQPI